MTCNCCPESAFRWRESPRRSIFTSDQDFTRAAHTGKTPNQISSEGVTRIIERTGRSPGSVFGISPAADRRTEQGIYDQLTRRSKK